MMRLTVPLSNGRAATVEARTMTELLMGLHALDFPARRMDPEEIKYLDAKLADLHDSAIGIEHLNSGDGGKPKPWVEDPVGEVYDGD
jgi:hypothetical protein